MRTRILVCLTLAGWLHSIAAHAQFGQNLPLQGNPPAGAQFLPRAGGQRINSQQFYPFGYGNPLNNYFNNSFYGGAGNFGGNGFGNNGFGAYGSPFGNPWQANQFAGNQFGGNPFTNPYQTPWGFGNMYSNSAPFGGYQYYGYGNFAPIVGVNNGWWPYQPAYNYNNPVDQYLQRLFISGLPAIPGGATVLPR